MAEIDYLLADKRVIGESERLFRELGFSWISGTGGFLETLDKGYTARMDVGKIYLSDPSSAKNVVAILFEPSDATGNCNDFSIAGIDPSWTPRKKLGEAELYVAVGSSVDGRWFSGLTSLQAVSTGSNPITTHCYRNLTLSQRDYLGILSGKQVPLSRFDFTFDRSAGFGNPHAIGFNRSLNNLGSFDVEYQIGAFVNFPEPCKELDFIRKRLGGSEAK